MNIDNMDFPDLDLLGTSHQIMTPTFGQFRADYNISDLVDNFNFEDSLIKLGGLLYEEELHCNLVTTAGIQIISATLMDEWREVANC
ncbi:hypothetical protein [Aeromonas hydrophila]|uniref:hypothetical protein n=1 Tax=Aeromonas hydrophila TaxID=644 RepID=UPI002B49BBD2|nr:hypothetical protein [Aeromonas hydrophila]